MEIKWLPIGSVVKLAEDGKPVMICGRAQKERETGKLWDYSACFYPEGTIAPEKTILFNREHVQTLLFIGYQTEENAAFTQQMDSLLEEATKAQED